MRKRITGFLVLALWAALTHSAWAVTDPNDAEGCKDPALFSRMPGFYIPNCEELDFSSYEFPIGPDKTKSVEGHYIFVDYYANDGIRIPSGLQVMANYANAAKAVGGEKVYGWEDGGTQYVTLKIAKGGAETWVQVSGANNGMYQVRIVEKQGMKQDVVANAAALAGSIGDTGRASVYGIHFDTGKFDIKPESEPALAEIGTMLKANPSLKLYVVGHTDNVGAFDYNVTLSKARAAAVVDALVSRHGVAAPRVTPFGAGPTAPVDSNTTEEGRAKNRRVDLVAQ